MLNNVLTNNVYFFDIETVSGSRDFSCLSDEMKEFWEHKSKNISKHENLSTEELYQKAGIYAEFGKIICISCGCFKTQEDETNLFLKSYYGDDENALLIEFKTSLEKFFSSAGQTKFLCGHNIKEFDIPYIARRMLINGITLPSALDISGKKPWETQFLDTMEMWKFGDYKSYTSLNLLTHIFGIPSPKDDIDGSMVNDIYYKDHDLERISTYCEKDVVATVQLFQKLRGEQIVSEENIIRV